MIKPVTDAVRLRGNGTCDSEMKRKRDEGDHLKECKKRQKECQLAILPNEIWKHIIVSISHRNNRFDKDVQLLLTATRVCKTWLWAARSLTKRFDGEKWNFIAEQAAMHNQKEALIYALKETNQPKYDTISAIIGRLYDGKLDWQWVLRKAFAWTESNPLWNKVWKKAYKKNKGTPELKSLLRKFK